MAYKQHMQLCSLLNMASELKTNQEKINILREFNSKPIRLLLRMIIDENIKLSLGEDEEFPKFIENKDQNQEFALYSRARVLWLQINSPKTANIQKPLRVKRLVELLEQIDYRDAEMLKEYVFKKKLPKGLTKKTIIEAFPSILNEQIEELQT